MSIGRLGAGDTAIQPTIFDAAGDLLYATAADTPARLAIGSSAQVLTVSSGLPVWATPSAGVNKNYLINGGFAISQRGTSFTSTGSANNDDSYTLDRWYILSDTNDVIDVTQDTTTVPTNGQFAIALDVETVNKKFGIATIIENKDIIGLIGNTVTFSFKAKVSATTKLDNVKAAIVAWSGTADTVTSDIISTWNVEGTNPTLIANATYENTPANLNLTTSYATYSISAAVDTASTKNLILFIWSDVTDTTLGDFLYISEAKLELGSSATAFVYAGGTLADELDSCQRYYVRFNDPSNTRGNIGNAIRYSGTNGLALVYMPTTMRIAPTALEFASLEVSDVEASNIAITAVTLASTYASNKTLGIDFTVASGLVANRPYFLRQANTTAGFLGVIAEL